jgi:hypothetical protein
VKKPELLKSHSYCFEVEMEVNSALTFSAGELCALVTDGLFALDDMGLLFPGVQNPDVGDRLTSIRMGATGYMRGLAAPTEDAYRRLMFGPKLPRTSKANRVLRERLEDARTDLSELMIYARVLMAKLLGMADKCDYLQAITDADRTIAEELLAAVKAITTTAETSIKPVL